MGGDATRLQALRRRLAEARGGRRAFVARIDPPADVRDRIGLPVGARALVLLELGAGWAAAELDGDVTERKRIEDPDVTAARIRLGPLDLARANFAASPWSQRAAFTWCVLNTPPR